MANQSVKRKQNLSLFWKRDNELTSVWAFILELRQDIAHSIGHAPGFISRLIITNKNINKNGCSYKCSYKSFYKRKCWWKCHFWGGPVWVWEPKRHGCVTYFFAPWVCHLVQQKNQSLHNKRWFRFGEWHGEPELYREGYQIHHNRRISRQICRVFYFLLHPWWLANCSTCL